jgi:CRP-like cAMP-binding protein
VKTDDVEREDAAIHPYVHPFVQRQPSIGGLALKSTMKPQGEVRVSRPEGNESDLRQLQAVPWFHACTDEQLDQVARLAERLVVDAGEALTKEGRIGRELFIILDGTATVTRSGRVINMLGSGDYFGELAAIDPAPRSATVTATSELDVLIIGPREFEAMTEIPGFRNALLTGMSQRLRAADDALAAHAEKMREAGETETPGHVAS